MDRNYKYKTSRLTIIKIKTEMGKPTGLWIQQLSYIVKVKSNIIQQKKKPQYKIRTRYKEYTDYGHQAIKKQTQHVKKDRKPTDIETRNNILFKMNNILNSCDYNARHNKRNKWITFDWHGLLTPPDWTRQKNTEDT